MSQSLLVRAPRPAFVPCLASVPRPIPRRASRSARGFTILEILIATAILTLGLVGILAIFPIAIGNGKKVMPGWIFSPKLHTPHAFGPAWQGRPPLSGVPCGRACTSERQPPIPVPYSIW